MRNLYDVIKGSLRFNKFIIDDLVCVEYICPLEDEQLGLYTEFDYIIHVLSGKKTWTTIHGEWEVNAGETLYVKKGAAIITQSLDEEFCMLGFFLPDDLIRESLMVVNETLSKREPNQLNNFSATKLVKQDYLEGFFNSMLHYFRSDTQPANSIIKLKLKELILNLALESENKTIVSYLNYIKENTNTSLTQIMEANFCYNLQMDEFARLSHRSLSTFKRDFQNHYNSTPGRWLLTKRLSYAANLLLNSNSNITQVAFECGFEDSSHFSRVFKDKFDLSPSDYRKSLVK
ncbi:MAG: AraC-like DNA-binding protein [Crocinitomicaceae bacterium]|jgi:AraC-like DNA-binding protein